MQFVSGDTVLATVPLTAGKATYRLPASTPVGTYPVVARFAGDATVLGSESAPVTMTVNKVTTTTRLTVTPRLLVPPVVRGGHGLR